MPQVHGAARDALDYVARTHRRRDERRHRQPDGLRGDGRDPLRRQLPRRAGGASPRRARDRRRRARARSASGASSGSSTPPLSGLPAFLAREGGLHSGLMMAHVTAAALASESKALAHPASVDSIPTSANKEDHVSMGPTAACKAARVVANTAPRPGGRAARRVRGPRVPPAARAPRPPLEAVHALVREHVPAHGHDRVLGPEIEALARPRSRSRRDRSTRPRRPAVRWSSPCPPCPASAARPGSPARVLLALVGGASSPRPSTASACAAGRSTSGLAAALLLLLRRARAALAAPAAARALPRRRDRRSRFRVVPAAGKGNGHDRDGRRGRRRRQAEVGDVTTRDRRPHRPRPARHRRSPAGRGSRRRRCAC